MENAKFFTKGTEFFILKFPSMITTYDTNVTVVFFYNLLESFLNAKKASLLDSKNNVHVNLEKSSTITRA